MLFFRWCAWERCLVHTITVMPSAACWIDNIKGSLFPGCLKIKWHTMYKRAHEWKVSSCCLTCCYLLFIVVRAGVETMCQSLGASPEPEPGTGGWHRGGLAGSGEACPGSQHSGHWSLHWPPSVSCWPQWWPHWWHVPMWCPGGPWPGAPPPGCWHELVSEADGGQCRPDIDHSGGSCLSSVSPCCVVCCYICCESHSVACHVKTRGQWSNPWEIICDWSSVTSTDGHHLDNSNSEDEFPANLMMRQLQSQQKNVINSSPPPPMTTFL